jgi:flagellum-specific ATP synthase
VVTPQQRDAARKFRRLLAAYEAKRDLISLGAYAKGSDPEVDEALAKLPKLDAFMRQDSNTANPYATSVDELLKAIA